jgi:hypothetical protein
MTVEVFPPLSVVPVALVPDEDQVKFRREAAPELKDRVEFGGPLITSIDSKYKPEDDDLQAFIRGQSDEWRFLLAHMSISFPPAQDPLARAAVQVSLSTEGGAGQALAYSLFPYRAGTSYDANRGYTLSPSLTVGPVSASLGSVDHTVVEHGTLDYVVGGPELSSRPVWNFQATQAQVLYGPTRLVMVIRAPVGHPSSLSVDLSAQIDEGLFRKQGIPLTGASAVNPAVVTF